MVYKVANPTVTNESKGDGGSDEGNASSSESEDEYDLKESGEKFDISFDKILYEPP